MSIRPLGFCSRVLPIVAALGVLAAHVPTSVSGEGGSGFFGVATLPVAMNFGVLVRDRSAFSSAAVPALALEPPRAQGVLAGILEAPSSRSVEGLPRVFAPSQPRQRHTRYPWKQDIVTTVFWIGERPTRNNPTPNHMSSWDMRWVRNYGGYDDPAPSARNGYIPAAFTPQQNPFYIALPYNDINRAGTKASARAMIPWFNETFYRNGRTVLKGRWLAIRKGGRVCYAQWEDVGPFETDDVDYVFGDARPKTKGNRGVGLDVSPAVRDYLKFDGGYGTVDWRFVDIDEVPDGPWRQWGTNNPFATHLAEAGSASAADFVVASELRERLSLSAIVPAQTGADSAEETSNQPHSDL